MAGYWAANLRQIAALLAIWLAVTFLPILLAAAAPTDQDILWLT
jgi:putative solute:sodium symporter small subunit